MMLNSIYLHISEVGVHRLYAELGEAVDRLVLHCQGAEGQAGLHLRDWHGVRDRGSWHPHRILGLVVIQDG